MGAREEMIEWFGDSVTAATAKKVADEILAEHARELAAAIRDEGDPIGWPDYLWAADLIDPDEEA